MRRVGQWSHLATKDRGVVGCQDHETSLYGDILHCYLHAQNMQMSTLKGHADLYMQLCYAALEQSSEAEGTRLEAGLHQRCQVRYALLLKATHVRLPCVIFQLVVQVLIGKGVKLFAVY